MPAAVDIAKQRGFQRVLVERVPVGMNAPVKGARDRLHAPRDAHVARPLLAQRLLQTGEQRIDKLLRERARAPRLELDKHQRSVEHQHIEAPVEGVGDAIIEEKRGLARTRRNARAQPARNALLLPAPLDGVKHSGLAFSNPDRASLRRDAEHGAPCQPVRAKLAQRGAGRDSVRVLAMRRVLLALSALALAGCVPVVNQRGYLPDPAGEASIKPGTDTETSVQARLGDPSTRAAFGSDSWYYISSAEKTLAFFDPKIETRAILAIHFDKDGKVHDLKHFSLKDGHVVAFESRQTPARGRELTFLQQLFNATPGVPIGNLSPSGQSPGSGAPGP